MKYKNYIGYFSLFNIAILLYSCSSNTSTSADRATNNDSSKVVSTDPAATNNKNASGSAALFICDVKSESDPPSSNITLSLNGDVYQVATTANACNEIERKEYAQYTIPENAIAACGGWWAGAGDYFYVVLKDGKPVVYQGEVDEEQSDNSYHWKEIEIKKKQ